MFGVLLLSGGFLFLVVLIIFVYMAESQFSKPQTPRDKAVPPTV
jgi:hypothetical protein